MQNPDPLIRTKLRLPFIRMNLVTRPDLQARFAEGLRSSLTLVIAPAGFGKTTLVASCLVNCGMPVAWLSLDEDDNQVERFLTYLTESLRSVDEKITSGAAQLLSDFQPAPFEAILTSLINGLDSLNSDIVLVLDDYHLIHNQDVNKQVAFLIEHCPHTFHLVIATRSDPPLPIARLRARDQLVELRSGDLRFTEHEAAQFLNDLMGLNLDEKFVAALEERTEGWIAGLQLAALSMHDRQDLAGFIKNFSGTNRYILDYLVEEALTRQPPEIQQFLLCTSILERMTASLCEAVLEQVNGLAQEDVSRPNPQISSHSHRSASILEYLEHSNLFLVPLDDERRWFRYHHLFADLLQARLSNSPFAGMIKSMHTHASAWFEANGFLEEAIHHALAAGDFPEAARQTEAAAENAWLSGQYASIPGWTRALPSQYVFNRPWLCIWNAWVSTQSGTHQEINRWIEAAEQAAGNEHEDAQALAIGIAALKAFVVSYHRDYTQAIGLAERVLTGSALKHRKIFDLIRCNTLHLLSSMYYATGQLVRAEQICLETIMLAGQIGFPLRYLHAVNKLILIYLATGQLARTGQTIAESHAFLEARGYHNYFVSLQLQFRKAELLFELNQLAEAERLVESVSEQVKSVDTLYLLVDFYNIQAYASLLKRDFATAQGALDRAADLARRSYIWEGLTWRTEQLQTRLWLQKGDTVQLEEWINAQPVPASGKINFSDERRGVAQARLLLAKGAPLEAFSLLKRLSAAAGGEGRKGSLVEILTLRAIALQTNGDPNQATAEIECALALAEPEGYIRSLVDEGQPLQELLVLYLERARSNRLRDYAAHILAQMDGSLKFISQDRAESSANSQLVEPLSPRELEVLHLMALGKTNQEIANKLIVARGTIKAQAVSIFRKLDASNRTEAVARARQLGILS
jgi:LuxR family transcriptional regulator, maltose regulon positive regulatory protein